MSQQPVPPRTRAQIEREAEQLLREHGAFEVPVDPIKLAHALKIKIYNATFDDDTISGVLARRGPNITMLINASDSAFRKRFTIAHELGHRVLRHFETEEDHTDRASDLYRLEPDAAEGPKRAEVQANWFAAALLMPAALVKSAFAETPDVDYLARNFQVSSEAMGIRLNTLGLL